MKAIYKIKLLFILLILSASVNAASFHIDSQSAYQGSSVTMSLFDDLTNNLEAATLRVIYDPTILSFSAANFGSVTSAFDAIFVDDSVSGIVDVSMATFGPPVDQSTGSLLSVTFNIFSNATPGVTNISMQCLYSPSSCLEPIGAVDGYHIPNTVGTLTILEKASTVPEPNVIVLLLTGFLGVRFFSRPKKSV